MSRGDTFGSFPVLNFKKTDWTFIQFNFIDYDCMTLKVLST